MILNTGPAGFFISATLGSVTSTVSSNVSSSTSGLSSCNNVSGSPGSSGPTCFSPTSCSAASSTSPGILEQLEVPWRTIFCCSINLTRLKISPTDMKTLRLWLSYMNWRREFTTRLWRWVMLFSRTETRTLHPPSSRSLTLHNKNILDRGY